MFRHRHVAHMLLQCRRQRHDGSGVLRQRLGIGHHSYNLRQHPTPRNDHQLVAGMPLQCRYQRDTNAVSAYQPLMCAF